MHYGILIYTHVDYEKGHMILNAKYNPEEDERFTEDPFLFREEIIETLKQYVSAYSIYYKLKYITLEVEYINNIYQSKKVPLKDVDGQPYRFEDDKKYEVVEKSIRERMTIIEKNK